jgi:hypothetical protein
MTRRKPSRRKPAGRKRPPKPTDYPKGWDQKRAAAMAEYYDNQSDEEAIAEAEAAYRDVKLTMMPVPVELVPEVHKLIERRRAG